MIFSLFMYLFFYTENKQIDTNNNKTVLEIWFILSGIFCTWDKKKAPLPPPPPPPHTHTKKKEKKNIPHEKLAYMRHFKINNSFPGVMLHFIPISSYFLYRMGQKKPSPKIEILESKLKT